MEKNYNYNYENRSQTKKSNSSVTSSSLSLSSCSSKDLKKQKVSNGKLWHTTDTNEFYYDWDGKRTKLNVTGDNTKLEAEIAAIKADMKNLDPSAVQQKINQITNKVNQAVSTVNNLKGEVNSAISTANSASQAAQDAAQAAQDAASQVADKASMSDVESAINTAVAGKADASDVTALQSTVAGKADKSELDSKADKSELESKADASDVTALQSTVAGKADKSELDSKADASTVSALQSTVAGKADKSELDSKADASDVTALQSTVAGKADKSELDSKADASTVSELQNTVAGKADKSDLNDYAKASDIPDVPTEVSAFINDAGYLTETDLPDFLMESDLDDFITSSELENRIAGIGGLSPEDRAKIDSIPDSGSFPEDVEGSEAGEDGYATVQDVMDFVNAFFEKKKDELEPSGEDKDYVYINADRFTGTEVPTSIYKVNCYEIDNIEPFNAYTGSLTAEGQAYLNAGKVSGTGFAFEVKAAPEIMGYEDDTDPSMNIYSELLTIDIPQGYTLEVHNFDEDHYSDSEEPFVTNFKGATRKYGKDTYNSYVRGAGDMYGGDGNVMNGVVRYLVILKQA